MTGIHTPPTVALLLTVAFIIFLFRRDIRERPNVTGALWLPLVFLLIIGSRSPTQWLALGGYVEGSSMEEGNPLDAFVFFMLMAAGIYVLNKRQVTLSEVARNNVWITVFLLFCFLAILWSDFPFVAFKRWIKILSHPIMALILLTEPDPEEAIVRLMKRAAYVLIPMSVLFIKYYPDVGRGFDNWTGAPMNNGIMGNKNELGLICLIVGFFFFWHLLRTLRIEKSKARRNELFLTWGFIYMILWLLSKSNSATSILSLLTASVAVILLGLRSVDKKLIGVYSLLVVVALAFGELLFGVFERVVDFTGHDATIAGRSELWRELLAFHTNPILGAGFESFWLGDRLKTLSGEHWWNPTEAHNGYLETYLNLGLVGLALLIGLIVATFRKISLELLRNFQFARFRLGFLIAMVVYNWTEASFKGLSPLLFVFYMIAMDYPKFSLGFTEADLDPGKSETETELVYAEEKNWHSRNI